MSDRAGLHALRRLTGDGKLLFATRFVRLFAYGGLSVVLVFHLTNVGLSESRIGLLLTLTLIGDTLITLGLATQADRIGRRRTLIIGAALMSAAGITFAFTGNWWLLIAAGTIGVISPSGHEVGPFLPIEQAALSRVVGDQNRTTVFAWYALAGSMATAFGALAAGTLSRVWPAATAATVGPYRAIVMSYAVLGVALGLLFLHLSPAAEAARPEEKRAFQATLAGLSGLDRSRGVVMRLSALFALDSFGGGFVIQSFAAYWFHVRFGVRVASLGVIFFWANVFAGFQRSLPLVWRRGLA